MALPLAAASFGLVTVYFYVFMEWLFLATKPSFLSRYGLGERVSIMITAPLMVALFIAAFQALIVGLLQLLLRIGPAQGFKQPVVDFLASVVPALILTVLAVLLLENFTLSLFDVGMRDAGGTLIGFYYLFVIAAFFFLLKVTGSIWRSLARNPMPVLAVGIGLIAFSVLALTEQLLSAPEISEADAAADPLRTPNIVLFSADGVPATRLSAYSYEKPTSPNLDRYLDRAIVFENAFSNASRTTASLTSMMTGKLPTQTKVLFPPHTLAGADAFQHLPGLLKGYGYHGIQETVRYYADAKDLNWIGAFDSANRREISWSEATSPGRFELARQGSSMLWARMIERVRERALQLVSAGGRISAFQQVSNEGDARVYGYSDEGRLRRVKAFIENSDGPFLAQIHLMGTHCCTLIAENPRFEIPVEATREERALAVLDNQIHESDRLFGDLMLFLESRGLLNDTIIVYSSDHSIFWGTGDRLPLIFINPIGEDARRVAGNAQMLDIAPTLLNWMGVEPPAWMEGRNLLAERGSDRVTDPIFSIAGLARSRFESGNAERLTRITNPAPPSYGLERFGMVVCDRYFAYSIREGDIEVSVIPGHTAPCEASALPEADDAKRIMLDHLHARGFAFPSARH